MFHFKLNMLDSQQGRQVLTVFKSGKLQLYPTTNFNSEQAALRPSDRFKILHVKYSGGSLSDL